MDDLHFMERLGRVATHEVELALGLYRDPELVRVLLKHEAPPDAARVAIALSDPALGPFVIVQRNGRFVTCLAAGMRTELPVITRERLERQKLRRADVRQRMCFLESTDDRMLVRMWRVMQERAHRVPREVMTTLTMVAPLLGSFVHDQHMKVARRVLGHLGRCPRLAAREGRWSAYDLAQLELIWRDVWLLGHLLVLDYSGTRERLAERHPLLATGDEFRCVQPFGVPLSIPFGPLRVRMAWAMARVGPTMLPDMKHFLSYVALDFPEGVGTSLGLAALAHAHPPCRAEVVAALRAGLLTDTSAFSAAALLAHCMDERLETMAGSRSLLYALGRIATDLPELENEALHETAARPDALELASLGATWLANGFCEGLSSQLEVLEMNALLPWLVQAEADELYWSEVDLARFEKPWEPKMSRDLVAAIGRSESLLRKGTTTTRTAPAKPGRNEPCTCGSGKKYKKCCGA